MDGTAAQNHGSYRRVLKDIHGRGGRISASKLGAECSLASASAYVSAFKPSTAFQSANHQGSVCKKLVNIFLVEIAV